MRNFPLTREDLDHLLQGGTLLCGDVQIALDDIGGEQILAASHKAFDLLGTQFNKVREVI